MATRQIIKIDEELCTGCGECVPACAEGALEIIDGKARVVAEVLCDGLGACIGECPEGALIIEERDAPAFDEVAVEQRLVEIGRPSLQHGDATAGGRAAEPAPAAAADTPVFSGCPGSLARDLGRRDAAVSPAATGSPAASGVGGVGDMEAASGRDAESLLGHWPVQLTLVNPMSPFLRGSDLLVAADCTAVAYRRFHEDFLQDRSVVIACPKLDDAQAHYEKLVELFQTARPRSVTVLRMEVPCCSGLVALARQAAEAADLGVPVDEIVIGVSGERMAAVPAYR